MIKDNPELDPVRVYHVRPMTGPIPAWLNSILSPILIAVKADAAPIEFCPLGRFSGFSAGSITTNPDQRISINSRLLLTSKTGIARIYVHELCHNLLEKVDQSLVHNHDAAFYCLNLILLRRMDDAQIDTGNASLHANSLSNYDLQDQLFCWKDKEESYWRPRELEWAIKAADKYRNSELSAAAIAGEIAEAYFVWADLKAFEPETLIEAKRIDSARRARELAVLAKAKSDAFAYKLASLLLSTLLTTVVFFV